MIVWVLIILLMGMLLTFGHAMVVDNGLVWQCGLAISLISLGILLRMFKLSKGGQREKLLKRIAELEAQVKQ